GRRMREDSWEYDPTHKLILCTNHKPKIRGTDHAIWRRIHLVPFTAVFKSDRQDKRLPEEVRQELPRIPAWAGPGRLAWQRGRVEPAKGRARGDHGIPQGARPAGSLLGRMLQRSPGVELPF